jgi:carotenoid cleavage dioxygenase
MFATSLLGPAEGTPTFERWTIDGRGGPVKETRLDDRGMEFPRADERRLGLPYRYGYGVTAGHRDADGTDDPIGTENGLIRHDLHTGATIVRHFGPTAQVGEGVFVPRTPAESVGDAGPTDAGPAAAGPTDDNETDGWLMALVYEGTTDTSSLYILNADDLDGDPQAVITLPQRVPVGFHGNWIPD